ncbi:BglG family transcription antiterminator [Facklamia miroungae]|uniref:PTS system, ascorbate-specific IIA component n=1 Tax=Facklamia miroungae TaxID=120956 RepID=A0A1G7UBF1_9LACT|nr:BglG family transcription antiterminator [Facklamia miroungae]NKZ30041.1 transcription antiterminator [Facklamia miroungae]SDG44777.1 PTS system, ascorbate-specific IIA component [Facklamia miroungae]
MIGKRSLYILKLILNNPDITTHEIQQKTNLSKRQVNYSIDNINQWLTDNHYNAIEKISGGKLILLDNVQDIISDLLKGNIDYVFDEEERQKIIFFYLYLHNQNISLFHLVDLLEVSRGTVTDDLKKLNKKLSSFKLSIKYSRENGYQLIGEETDIFYAMINFIVEVISYEEALYIIQLVLDKQASHLFYDFRKQLNQELSKDQLIISDNNIHIITYTFVFYLLRKSMISLPNKEKFWFKLNENSEFKLSKKILQAKNIFDLNDVEVLTALILSYSTKTVIKDSKEQAMIDQIIASVLERLNKTYAIAFKDRERIFGQLRMHIRPAINRMYFNFPMVNPLKDQILTKYGHIYTIIEDLFQQLNIDVIKSISEDDLAYLTIHFATFIKDTKDTDNYKLTGVIVCPSGIGVSVLLRNELTKLFPQVNFLKNVSVGQLNEVIKEIDVVFSTVLIETDKPLFIVNPVMNNIDKANLLKHFNKRFANMMMKETININSLMMIIEKYSDVKDKKGLMRELSYLLSAPTNQILIRKEQPMLSEITNNKLIQLKVEAKDWKEAIQKSAEVMKEEGKITDDYIRAMINNTESNGPYIVITKHVALPHARPEDGVIETAIGITTLKEPVVFGHELHDPVKYVFCLSTVDNNSHLKALAELVDLLDDVHFYELLEKAEEPQEILNYIKGKEG